VNALKKFLSPEEEPVRSYLYRIAGSVISLLIVLGVLTGTLGAALLAVAATVLVVAPTAELIRSKVSPDRPAYDPATDPELEG
jgi:hypothetical protein